MSNNSWKSIPASMNREGVKNKPMINNKIHISIVWKIISSSYGILPMKCLYDFLRDRFLFVIAKYKKWSKSMKKVPKKSHNAFVKPEIGIAIKDITIAWIK